ncbi:DUF6362 family protein [Pelagibius sp. 7325]|uniref:DUF6362 family protein n=1 Tax=Pelagibius sp. 7325 TaxID=3131994 RepID=UPI0030EC9B73
MLELQGKSAAPNNQPTKQIDATIAQGLALAREAGNGTPGLRDAVWELLLEAGDTLQRLPNRERGWLTAASRAHWPDYLRSAAEQAAADAAPIRPGPASGEAIDRLDTVLAWLRHAAGSNPKRDVAVLFGLACGVKVASLRRRLGCGRRTVYDVRDRGIARICSRLRAESAFCRSLA